MFALGITDRDVEGQWVWDSDGSPVTWTRWIFSEPTGDAGEDYVLMVRHLYSGMTDHKSEGWLDYDHDASSITSNPKSLICQKYKGKWI